MDAVNRQSHHRSNRPVRILFSLPPTGQQHPAVSPRRALTTGHIIYRQTDASTVQYNIQARRRRQTNSTVVSSTSAATNSTTRLSVGSSGAPPPCPYTVRLQSADHSQHRQRIPCLLPTSRNPLSVAANLSFLPSVRPSADVCYAKRT